MFLKKDFIREVLSVSTAKCQERKSKSENFNCSKYCTCDFIGTLPPDSSVSNV